MNSEKRLLIVEDESAIVGFLRPELEKDGWTVLESRTATVGLKLAASLEPKAILLDLGLPNYEALGCLRALRQWSAVPVILLVSAGEEAEQTICLEAGADDYLVKPFGILELNARLRLALRHAETRAETDSPIYEHAGVRLDLFSRRAWVRNKEIHLSPFQYEFLAILIRHAGRVVAYRDLVQGVWGEKHEVTPEYMRVFVYQLRQKIEANPSKPRCLKTVAGMGCWMEAPAVFTNKLLMAQQ